MVLIAAVLALWVGSAGAQQRKPFEVFRDCPACPELVALPAGRFVMGSGDGQQNEMPARPVTLARPFAIGRFETTFDEWDACVAARACTTKPDDHKWGRSRMPVMNITWYDAKEYVAWLTRLTGRAYRLPTDAEWEYAARAGTVTAFWWGDTLEPNRANCRDCTGQWLHGGKAFPVGSFPPNPWGLYDMSGNLWEWIEDCWNTSNLGAPADGRARLTGDCNSRVMRSGAWYYVSKNMRSSWRFKNDARVRSYWLGVRVVRELP